MALRSPLATARRPDRLEEPLVTRFRERVLAALADHVERIVLFGSRARGDEHAESDWDFAVFFDRPPTKRDQRVLSDLTSELWEEFDVETQSLAFPSQTWVASDELACNIREHGRIVYGPPEVPMLERPVLQHARAALAKAERFAAQADQALPQAYETVVHNSYYAMFHAARAALLVVEGSASTNHGRVVDTFQETVRRRRMKAAGNHAANLKVAFKLRMKADYGSDDLTEAAGQLREQVGPFLAFSRELVDQATGET